MQEEKKEQELSEEQLGEVVGGLQARKIEWEPHCGTDTSPPVDPFNREIEGDYRPQGGKLGYRNPGS